MKINQKWIRAAQHFAVKYLQIAGEWYEKRWVKITLGVFVVLLIFKKDINLSVDLMNPVSVESSKNQLVSHHEAVETNEIEPPSELMASLFNFDSIPKHLSRHMLSQSDANLANTFSNLGFLLNPELAKRIKIDPKIVAFKRKKCDDYLKRFAPLAVESMEKYGIPASITLAQGLLESNVGDSRLAKENNNHFGIKCFETNCKTGHCTNYTDDSHKDFFRKYANAAESYQAHSRFLQRPRYAHLEKLGTKDYKNWAHGLRKAGYATDKKYGPKLIKIIEALKLYRFDA